MCNLQRQNHFEINRSSTIFVQVEINKHASL